MYFGAQFVLSCQNEIYLKSGFFFFLDLFALVYHKSFFFLKHNATYFISVSSVCSLNLALEKIIILFFYQFKDNYLLDYDFASWGCIILW